MAIRTKNIGEQIIEFVVPALQAADTNLAIAFADFDGFIKNIYAELITAGITGNQKVDIHKNGVTIFGGATKINFATTSKTATYDTVTDVLAQIVKGDLLSLDVDSIHSGTAGDGLLVQMRIVRGRPGALTNVAPASLN